MFGETTLSAVFPIDNPKLIAAEAARAGYRLNALLLPTTDNPRPRARKARGVNPYKRSSGARYRHSPTASLAIGRRPMRMRRMATTVSPTASHIWRI